MACHIPLLEKSKETNGSAITHPQSHLIHILRWVFTLGELALSSI